jgi:hypothetical protein
LLWAQLCFELTLAKNIEFLKFCGVFEVKAGGTHSDHCVLNVSRVQVIFWMTAANFSSLCYRAVG